MDEYKKKWIGYLVCAVIFLVCLMLVITGQKSIGYPGLIQMLIGLAGLLGLLYFYNRSHSR